MEFSLPHGIGCAACPALHMVRRECSLVENLLGNPLSRDKKIAEGIGVDKLLGAREKIANEMWK
jgi:hypothetical protein